MITNLSPMYRMSDGNVVQFYEMPVPNDALSQGEGRPVVWKALMAIIRGPGMKNQEQHQQIYLYDEKGKQVKRAMHRMTRDKRKLFWDEFFKDQLAAYNEGRSGTDATGTPLEQYPKIDVAQAAMLRASGIHSLEQLQAVPDTQLGTLGPAARELRDGAARMLDSMSGKDAMFSELQKLRAQVAELSAAQNAPKRGRPRKADAEAKAA